MSHGAQSFWQWDGARYSPAVAVPLADRGLRYGMSVFESIRVAAGQADFLAEHCESLRRACETLRFPVPTGVLEALGPVLSGTEGDVFARIYVTAGDGRRRRRCSIRGCSCCWKSVRVRPRKLIASVFARRVPRCFSAG